MGLMSTGLEDDILSTTSRLRSVLNAISDPVLTTSPDHSIRRVNRAFMELFGYAADDLTGESLQKLLPVDGAGNAFAIRAMRSCDLAALVGKPHEMELTDSAGKARLFELKADPIDDPEMPGYVLVMRDLSLREHSRLLASERDKLAASEIRFRDFAECGSDWFWEIDADLRFTYMSPQVETATGYPPEWHLGHTREELGLDDDNDDLMRGLYVETAELKEFQERVQVRRRKDGGLAWVAFSGKPILGEKGEFIGYRGVSRDVTSVVVRENELKATNAELESFAYAASHDLQEPLRKIMAFSERLTEEVGDDLPELPSMYLSRISAASERMSTLIRNLLDFSRVGHPSDAAQDVDLNRVFDQVQADLVVAIRKSGAVIRTDSLPTVSGHESQFYQLFCNLMTNALKFVRADVVPEVSIKVHHTDNWLVVEVADNGIGFDDSSSDKIFELFGRLHGRSKFEGTGLGLAICRKVIEFHRGTIEGKGVPGQGATFTVRLPIRLVRTMESSYERVA